ncbi:hypothetical protein ALT761_00928 [Alteromonas sp. 76-1]|uniref:hypothetical protein n=1 Tax=Alteromonas sp. 76-1 TaxID=2358187 RepID=UPI000FD15D57|nr:hypothetical protein [Alteromonas sp. 76-1]VEL95969.1 hypothetical protein ALT761_00928 [Alteromonas sp. 76-1]
MNQYLTTLLCTIGIDVDYLISVYLSPKELEYIDRVLTSKKDYNKSFYTDENGDRLEVLLMFLTVHKEDIIDILEGREKSRSLIELYTSPVISGSYECFRFDLSKFPQNYIPQNQSLTLFKIGRKGESEKNLGCSWAREIDGLNTYYYSSCMSETILQSRPIFLMEIDDSQVLFDGDAKEHEIVLKPNFTLQKLKELNTRGRKRIVNQLNALKQR